MVTVLEMQDKLQLKPLTSMKNKQVTGAYVCDLLSWVMAQGSAGMAWITVQTHLNVVAVAALKEFSCVIVPEDIEVPKATLDKAEEEGVVFFSSAQTAYGVCRSLAGLGV